jgi:predicted nucleotidyltransferase
MTEELIKRLRKWAKSDLGLIVMYEAADTIEAQAAEIKRLREILARHVDGEQPCWRDHHGYCQAHYLEEDCRVAAARAALGETE